MTYRSGSGIEIRDIRIDKEVLLGLIELHKADKRSDKSQLPGSLFQALPLILRYWHWLLPTLLGLEL